MRLFLCVIEIDGEFEFEKGFFALERDAVRERERERLSTGNKKVIFYCYK